MRKTKKEKQYEKYIAESLEDEHLYDPETGTKITLEQAESGHWINHDNEFKPIDLRELEKFQTKEEKDSLTALNYLITTTNYKKAKFSEEEINILEKLRILDKYDDWSYDSLFKPDYFNGFIFSPTIQIQGDTRYNEGCIESQLMFWVKIKHNLGHYYLREKKVSEKVFDFFRNDDELKLNGYESFTYKKTNNLLYINQILKHFENEKGFEIEFLDDNIFIKSVSRFHLDEILRLEKIIVNIC